MNPPPGSEPSDSGSLPGRGAEHSMATETALALAGGVAWARLIPAVRHGLPSAPGPWLVCLGLLALVSVVTTVLVVAVVSQRRPSAAAVLACGLSALQLAGAVGAVAPRAMAWLLIVACYAVYQRTTELNGVIEGALFGSVLGALAAAVCSMSVLQAQLADR